MNYQYTPMKVVQMSRAIGIRFSDKEYEALERVCGMKQVSRNKLMRQTVVSYLEKELANHKAKIRRTKTENQNPQPMS